MTEKEFNRKYNAAISQVYYAAVELEQALASYNSYQGNSHKIESQLAENWYKAESNKKEAEKKLLALQTQQANKAVMV